MFGLSILLLLSSNQIAVIDGDTIRVGHERVRLLGIDAPEFPGHCRKGRACAPGDPSASKRNLKALLTGSVRIIPVARDRYGRVVAQVYSGGRNVACEQLRAGQAVYVGHWDNGGRLGRECRQP